MKAVQEHNLALPIDIQGGEWDTFFLRMSAVISLFFLVLIGIASVAPLYEVALTIGKIVPQGSVVRVEHYEGGIVKDIYFRSGDRVKKGDVIVSLTPTAAVSEQDQMAAKYINLKIKEIRLKALLAETDVDFGTYSSSHPKLVADHKALFEEAKRSLKHTIGGLTSRVKEKTANLKALELEAKSLKSQLAIHREQFQMRKTLVKDGYTTKTSYLDAKAKVAETEARLAQLEGQLLGAVNQLTETEQQLAETVSKERQRWSTELTEVSAGISEIDAVLGKVEDRVNRLDVRAPMDGLIQTIHPKAVGEVISPGDLVAEMVPGDDLLLAEVRLKPEDATNIRPGMKARVTVTAFDVKEFGRINGRVLKVSPTTFSNDKGEEYYEVRVGLEKLILRRKGVDHEVLPGMVVQAELIKGERSVLKYLLKPLFTAVDNSFGEH